MAYVKYKEVTKYFNFSKVLNKTELPWYIKDYVFEDEILLVSYKTSRDHGVFTDKKIVLFDNFGINRQIFTIPYKSISTCSIVFKTSGGEIMCFLDSGYPLRLKFVNMKGEDKLRLRLLYSCISRRINDQQLDNEVVRRLLENDVSWKN